MLCPNSGKLSLPYDGAWEIAELTMVMTMVNMVIRLQKGTKTVTKKVHVEKLTQIQPALGPRFYARLSFSAGEEIF